MEIVLLVLGIIMQMETYISATQIELAVGTMIENKHSNKFISRGLPVIKCMAVFPCQNAGLHCC